MGRMTTHSRRTLVALAATLTLALAGCGGEEAEGDAPPATPPDGAPAEPAEEATHEKSGADKETSPPDPVDEVVVDVTVTGNDVTPVAQSVELAVGETLLLEVNSDRAGELHVHSSPEQFADFEAGASRLDFTFDKPGS